jgi:hypothetical protein
MSVGKPALGSEAICFSKGAEQAIPPGEVPVIESMHIQLMMDGVMLGPLQDESNPMRGTQVTVIKILPRTANTLNHAPAVGDAPKTTNISALARMESAAISIGCL